VEAEVTANPAVTLAAGLTERPASVARAMEQLALHQRRAQGEDAHGVRTETGLAELDEALPWLTWRIAHGTARPVVPTTDLLWWGLGALAVDAPEAALRALTALENRGADDEAALLAARMALVSGNRYAAADAEIEALRAAAETSRRGAASPTKQGLKLPMAGGASGPTRPALPSWLVAVLDRTLQAPAGADDTPIHDHPDPAQGPSWTLREAIRLVGLLSVQAPDAYGRWRRLLADGMDGGAAGRGNWDPQELCPAVAGALACGLLHGMLAWDPDAPVGRLGLGPRLPGHLAAFHIAGLHMGDVRVTMAYRKEGHRHRFSLEPTSGRVPASVVFQPTVAAGSITEARLDGDPVRLDFERTRDGGTTRVQIPLDGPRVLELSTQERAP
jgi:hypothetical protein